MSQKSELTERWNSDIGRRNRDLVLDAIQSQEDWLLDDYPWGSHAEFIDLRGITFERLDLSQSKLNYLALDYAVLDGANLSKAEIQFSSLNNISALSTKFDNAFFAGIHAGQSCFDNSSFIGTEFRSCEFVKSTFLHTRFNRSVICGVEFSYCKMNQADFRDISGSTLAFRNSDVSRVAFDSAILEALDFEDCNDERT